MLVVERGRKDDQTKVELVKHDEGTADTYDLQAGHHLNRWYD